MKVNYQRDISFKNIYTNKTLKRGLEFAADKGALFAAITTVGFSVIRPLVIMNTPKAEKENKKIASAKSIASSLIGLVLMLLLSTPLSKSITKIDKNPQKYLNNETIKSLKDSGKKLENSKGYIFATQLFKLGIGTAAAIPKACLVAAGIPQIMQLFNKKSEPSNNENSNISFKANPTEKLAHGVGKILNKNSFKNFANKYKDSNFPMHITALTDIIATGAFAHQIKKSEKIKEERKSALIYNSAIATGLSVAGGYIVDRILNKPTEKFIENFKKANRGQKNLQKQIQGIKIAKPILILGTIYYIMIPLISTFLAEKADDAEKQKRLINKFEK